MDKHESVYAKVKDIYESSTREMGRWMWSNHVQWVAKTAKSLAEKYQADADKVYCAALLHDIADSQYERNHPEFDAWSTKKAVAILTSSGFEQSDVDDIVTNIISPHSCKPENLPTTLEGKVMATADALFHIQTSFFPILCYMNNPKTTHTYDGWQEWFEKKIDRDYKAKIFFDDEREMARKDYEALVRVFSNKTLKSV